MLPTIPGSRTEASVPTQFIMTNHAAVSTPAKKTLFQRLGGDPFITLMVASFFDEIVEDPSLAPFFENISVSALKVHQVKLFGVIFGSDEEKPDPDDLLNFMLATHTRLFREHGLDATHFDKVATCFVQGLQSFMIDQDLIDECVAILMPLRKSFEYGAQVAAREKGMEADQLKSLPVACAKRMDSDIATVLPEPASIEIPDWLPEALAKSSKEPLVRAWTCKLTDRFGAEGDEVVADVFMDMPYMNHHVYLVAFLQLAFLPAHIDDDHVQNLLCMIRYPRGPEKAPLSRDIFDRMVVQFKKVCVSMSMRKDAVSQAESQLHSHGDIFPKTVKYGSSGGVKAPHSLRKVKVEIDASMKQARPNALRKDDATSVTSSGSSLSLLDDESEDAIHGFKWRKLLGWVKTKKRSKARA